MGGLAKGIGGLLRCFGIPLICLLLGLGGFLSALGGLLCRRVLALLIALVFFALTLLGFRMALLCICLGVCRQISQFGFGFCQSILGLLLVLRRLLQSFIPGLLGGLRLLGIGSVGSLLLILRGLLFVMSGFSRVMLGVGEFCFGLLGALGDIWILSLCACC